ncbi:MAG: cytochrome b/b6 domain-containing protein [Kiritimatiellales bacterium]|nr:cytochrome b/b6 domain-containing protein [Kiritimatiellales bacterium]
MSKILVWDIPSRIFHWAFAGSLTAAMAIGFLVDDEQPLFQLHMLFGIVALFLLVVRLVMGVVGSRYSRFSSYPLHPREFIVYMISAVASKTKLYAGNNPGSAMSAMLMFLLVPALFISGNGYGGEPIEELHEFFAWAFLATLAFHLAGLAWHTIRHRENIALVMVTGRKAGHQEDAISSAHPLWGGFILLVSGLWIAALFAGHNANAATVRLPGIGVTLQLGENESESGEQEQGHDDDD